LKFGTLSWCTSTNIVQRSCCCLSNTLYSYQVALSYFSNSLLPSKLKRLFVISIYYYRFCICEADIYVIANVPWPYRMLAHHPISAFDAGWQPEILSPIARLPAGLYYSILFVQKMRAFRRLVLECFISRKPPKLQ
jgi:hypothetical protein